MTYKIDRAVELPVSLLNNNSWNPNRCNDKTKSAIKGSLKKFGQFAEVLVRPHPNKKGEYEIIDGEHRTEQILESGIKTIFCNVIHGLSDARAKELTIIADGTRGDFDKIELSQLLAELSNDSSIDDLLESLPYTDQDLADMVAIADVNWDDFGEDNESSYDGEPAENDPTVFKIYAEMPETNKDVIMDKFNELKSQLNIKENAEGWGEFIYYLCS